MTVYILKANDGYDSQLEIHRFGFISSLASDDTKRTCLGNAHVQIHQPVIHRGPSTAL